MGSIGIENEEQVVLAMMCHCDELTSLADLWKTRIGDVSIFQYHSTLATLFFGLNLVRFEFNSSGQRTLEVI